MSSNPKSIRGNDTTMKFVATNVLQEYKTYDMYDKSLAKEESPPSANNGSLFVVDDNTENNDLNVRFGTVPSINSRLNQQRIDSKEAACSYESKSRKGNETGAYSLSSETFIWTDELEAALEEALTIIPKFGCNKTNISGRLYGRNELIAEYIFAKTGVVRSRKQVASHIQVVKNVNTNRHLIDLIDNGPQFKCKEDRAKSFRRFRKVFAKITENKSLGLKLSEGTELTGTGIEEMGSHFSAPQEEVSRFKRDKSFESIVAVRDINFTISGETEDEPPIILTMQKNKPWEHVNIKVSTDITSRIPGVDVFHNTFIPIFHNDVKMLSSSKMEWKRILGQKLNTNYTIESNNHGEKMAMLSTVYSFEDEVLRINEIFEPNLDQPFLIKFWNSFFLQFIQCPFSLHDALKGITVKQILYDNTDPIINVIPQSKIAAVLLWEFSGVQDIHEAISTSSRLFLAPPLVYESIIPG